MKKIFYVVVVILCSFYVCCVKEKHVHELNSEYSYNDEYHYKTCKNCEQIFEQENHILENKHCIICDYVIESSNLNLILNDEKTGYIVSNTGFSVEENIIIPSSYKGLPVLEIADCGFEYNTNLIEITIPESIKKIGKNVFVGCDKLTTINISNKELLVEQFIEFDGKSIKWNEYNNGLYLGNEENEYLVFVKMKDKDQSSCIINDNTKMICSNAFMNCENLKDIRIPDGIEIIGEKTFIDIPKYNYNEYDNGLYLGNEVNKFLILVSLRDAFVKSHIINEETRIINSRAFVSNLYITNITIPDSVLCLGSDVFKNCVELKQVILPTNITRIPNGTFRGCKKIENIIIPNTVTSIGLQAFSSCSKLSNVEMPDSVIEIEDAAFNGCISLTEIKLPINIKVINRDVFNDCSSLRKVNISNNVKVIKRNAFSFCKLLTDIEIPSSVEIIEMNAFSYCAKIKKLNIPESVKVIENSAFAFCDDINSIIVDENNPIYDSRDNCNAIIKTKTNSLVLACNTSIVPEGITKIENYAFCGSTKYTNISIPNSITNIEPYAFDYIPDEILNKYDNALYIGNKSNKYMILYKVISNDINSCIINNETKYIWDKAFVDCKNLITITIPKSVIYIGNKAFFYCSKLEIINVEEGNTKYDSRDNCNAIIETLTNELIVGCMNTVIPDNVVSIYDEAFCYVSDLLEINIPNSVINIGENVFYGCNNLYYYEYKDGLYLGNETNNYLVFVKAKETNKTKFQINENTKIILSNAFRTNYFNDIIIPNGIISIGDDLGVNKEALNEYDNGLYLGNEENKYLIFVKLKDIYVNSCTINENTKFICSNAFHAIRYITITLNNDIVYLDNNIFGNLSDHIKYRFICNEDKILKGWDEYLKFIDASIEYK